MAARHKFIALIQPRQPDLKPSSQSCSRTSPTQFSGRSGLNEMFYLALSYLNEASGRRWTSQGSNSMSGFVERRFLRFVFLAASFIAIPAFAQFEIAPDHF